MAITFWPQTRPGAPDDTRCGRCGIELNNHPDAWRWWKRGGEKIRVCRACDHRVTKPLWAELWPETQQAAPEKRCERCDRPLIRGYRVSRERTRLCQRCYHRMKPLWYRGVA